MVPLVAMDVIEFERAVRRRIAIELGLSTAAVGDVLTSDGIGSAVMTPPVPTTPSHRQAYVLEGASASAGQTTLVVALGGGTPPAEDDLGIPVPIDMDAATVAVSWLSDSNPGGDWTATLWRRAPGGSFNAVATFDLQTS